MFEYLVVTDGVGFYLYITVSFHCLKRKSSDSYCLRDRVFHGLSPERKAPKLAISSSQI